MLHAITHVLQKSIHSTISLVCSTEDSATVTSVLVPWTACGMTQSTVLGIPTLVYLPFCFFNIISPLMSCLVAILGFVPKPQPQQVAEEN